MTISNFEVTRVPIYRARELARLVGVLIRWRPEPRLPESEQYALVYGMEAAS